MRAESLHRVIAALLFIPDSRRASQPRRTRRTRTAEAERALTRYPWPGKMRELQHCLKQPLSDHLQECERAYIRRALSECGGRIVDTAALLGISRKNLWGKMRKLEMGVD